MVTIERLTHDKFQTLLVGNSPPNGDRRESICSLLHAHDIHSISSRVSNLVLAHDHSVRYNLRSMSG